jgi:RNA recognition motif-containing protein
MLEITDVARARCEKGKKSQMNIYVGNLPFSTSAYDLEELFGEYGSVDSASVINDRETGRSRGFGFVEMDDEAGRKAIEELDGKDYGGRNLKVNEARPREDRRR